MADAPEFRTTMNFAYGEPRELAPGVVRIVANNPSPFTFKGTNTYIVGTDQLALIDPGPDDPAHLEAILQAIGGRPLTHILITHTHRDHTDGLPALLAAVPGTKTAGFGRKARVRGEKRTSPSGSEFVDKDFTPDIPLADGDRLSGKGWTFHAIHTPGHAPDHLCFALEGTGVLFSGDHVMGWNTSVIAPPEGNMGDYMRALEVLNARSGDKVFFPGHGGQIEEPQRMVKAFLLHRRMREQAVLDCIRGGTNTVNAIVPVIYRDLNPKLLNAAALSVQAHVEHLIDRGLVRCDSPLSADRPLSAA
jgi:glyoxylase-like metal-dependent hydrolase (beta-lactamase superfamily II)